MLGSADDVPRILAEGRSLLGPGWKAVDSFDDLDDPDEFEETEEEIYVTMDLGNSVDNRVFQTETQYQLIGLDTPLPFLRLANQIFQGESTPLIGDEVILGLLRNQENPHNPSRPPIHTTHHRLTFQPVTLRPFDAEASEQAKEADNEKAMKVPEEKSIFRPTRMRSKKAVGPPVPLSSSALDRSMSTIPSAIANDPSPVPEAGSSRMVFERPKAGPLDDPGPPTKKRGRSKGSKNAREPPSNAVSKTVDPNVEPQPVAGPSQPAPIASSFDVPKKRGRPKSLTNRMKVFISDPSQLDELDIDNLAINARIEITTDAQSALGFDAYLPSGVDADKTIFTKAEVRRMREGRPVSGPGSRGGRVSGQGAEANEKYLKTKEVVERNGLVFAVVGESDGEQSQDTDQNRAEQRDGEGMGDEDEDMAGRERDGSSAPE